MNDDPLAAPELPASGQMEERVPQGSGHLSPRQEGAISLDENPLQVLEADLVRLIQAHARAVTELEEERRRCLQEKKEFLLEILEVMDAFDRLFENLKQRADTLDPQTKLVAGNFRAVRRLVSLTLERAGVSPLEVTVGSPALPEQHQIMETRPDSGMEGGVILEVIRAGYLWHGEILRYPWVAVVKNA